jgi:hypothetical protein
MVVYLSPSNRKVKEKFRVAFLLLFIGGSEKFIFDVRDLAVKFPDGYEKRNKKHEEIKSVLLLFKAISARFNTTVGSFTKFLKTVSKDLNFDVY